MEKMRQMLFFCVSEISEIFCVDVFVKVFQVYEMLFECSNNFTKFHENEIELLNQKQEEILKYEELIDLGKRYKGILAKNGLDSDVIDETHHKQFPKSEKRSRSLSNGEKKEFQKRSVRRKFNDLNDRIEKARRRAFFSNFVLTTNMDDLSDFLPQKEIDEFEIKKKREFEKNVNNAVGAIYDHENKRESKELLQTLFDPKVIVETARKVFGKMIEEKSETVDDINRLISRISKYKKKKKLNSMRELELLAWEMKDILAKQGQDMLNYKNSDLLKKEYLPKFLKSAQKQLLNRIGKNNRDIAYKAIDIYKDSKQKYSNDASTQTLMQNSFLGQLFPENPLNIDFDYKQERDQKKLDKINRLKRNPPKMTLKKFQELFTINPNTVVMGKTIKVSIAYVPKLDLNNRRHLFYLSERLEFFPGTPLKSLIKQPKILQKKIKMLENTIRMKTNQMKKISIDHKRQVEQFEKNIQNLEKMKAGYISRISRLEIDCSNRETRVHFLRKEVSELQKRLDDESGDEKYKKMRGVLYAAVEYIVKLLNDMEKCPTLVMKTLLPNKPTEGSKKENSFTSVTSRIVDVDYQKVEKDMNFLLVNKGSLYNLRKCLKRIKLHANDAIFDRYELKTDNMVKILNAYKNFFLFDLKHFETHKVRYKDIYLPNELNFHSLKDTVYFFLSKKVGMLLFSGLVNKRLLKILKKKLKAIKVHQRNLKSIRNQKSVDFQKVSFSQDRKAKPSVPKLSDIKKEKKADEEEILDIFNQTLADIEQEYSVASHNDMDLSILSGLGGLGDSRIAKKKNKKRNSSLIRQSSHDSLNTLKKGLNKGVLQKLITNSSDGNNKSVDSEKSRRNSTLNQSFNLRNIRQARERNSLFSVAKAKGIGRKMKMKLSKQNSVLVPVEESEIVGADLASIVSLKKTAKKIKKVAKKRVESLHRAEEKSKKEGAKKRKSKKNSVVRSKKPSRKGSIVKKGKKKKSKVKKKEEVREEAKDVAEFKVKENNKQEEDGKNKSGTQLLLDDLSMEEDFKNLDKDLMNVVDQNLERKESSGSDKLNFSIANKLKSQKNLTKSSLSKEMLEVRREEAKERKKDYIKEEDMMVSHSDSHDNRSFESQEEIKRSKKKRKRKRKKKYRRKRRSESSVLTSDSRVESRNRRREEKRKRREERKRRKEERKRIREERREAQKNIAKVKINPTYEFKPKNLENLGRRGQAKEFVEGEKIEFDFKEKDLDDEMSYYSIDSALNMIKKVKKKMEVFQAQNQGQFTFLKDKAGVLVKVKTEDIIHPFSFSGFSESKSESLSSSRHRSESSRSHHRRSKRKKSNYRSRSEVHESDLEKSSRRKKKKRRRYDLKEVDSYSEGSSRSLKRSKKRRKKRRRNNSIEKYSEKESSRSRRRSKKKRKRRRSDSLDVESYSEKSRRRSKRKKKKYSEEEESELEKSRRRSKRKKKKYSEEEENESEKAGKKSKENKNSSEKEEKSVEKIKKKEKKTKKDKQAEPLEIEEKKVVQKKVSVKKKSKSKKPRRARKRKNRINTNSSVITTSQEINNTSLSENPSKNSRSKNKRKSIRKLQTENRPSKKKTKKNKQKQKNKSIVKKKGKLKKIKEEKSLKQKDQTPEEQESIETRTYEESIEYNKSASNAKIPTKSKPDNRSTENNTQINNESVIEKEESSVHKIPPAKKLKLENMINSIVEKLEYSFKSKAKIFRMLQFLLMGLDSEKSHESLNQREIMKSKNEIAKNQFKKILKFFDYQFKDLAHFSNSSLKNSVIKSIKKSENNIDILIKSILLSSKIFKEEDTVDHNSRANSLKRVSKDENGFYLKKNFQKKNSRLKNHKSQSLITNNKNKNPHLPSVKMSNQFNNMKSNNSISRLKRGQKKVHFRNLSSGNLNLLNQSENSLKRQIYLKHRNKFAKSLNGPNKEAEAAVNFIVDRREFNPLGKENLENPLYLVKKITTAFIPQEEPPMPNVAAPYKDQIIQKNVNYDFFKKKEKFQMIVKKELGKYLKLHQAEVKDDMKKELFSSMKYKPDFLMSIEHLQATPREDDMSCNMAHQSGRPCKHLKRFYTRLMWIYKEMVKRKGEPLVLKKVNFGDAMQDMDRQRKKGIFEKV